MRALGIDGLSVTMPHKAAAAEVVDRLSPTAKRLGAVNTVVRRGGRLDGETTDGDGLLAALRLDDGWDPAGRRCAVLGTGERPGRWLSPSAEAGVAEVVVAGRRLELAEATALLAGRAGGTAGIEQAAGVDLIVNATPVGMAGVVGLDGEPLAAIPFDLDTGQLGADQLVVDLVYAPAVTPLLAAARARGAGTANGLGMLIHQAALQFRLWTGADPPLEVMSAAALAALAVPSQ